MDVQSFDVAHLIRELIAGIQPLPEQSAVYNRDPQQELTDLPSTKSIDTPAGAPESVGEGIGLHIVKHLCDLLGANIDVETSPTGTLFRIRLLIEQPPSNPADA